ncbi:hypothetical protein GXM_00345 [Nostoc sphaeroides CCNUC1]|uniref:Uncharacterized protein n=1 Tax=Nostoc sphaeroides CCNUC1 TaxID=2653204 RepID=A0A5P8VR14_9NOSO|nr:hypothetical protein GXM_00345 [Nostoc sphaeroides CCNUC1]
MAIKLFFPKTKIEISIALFFILFNFKEINLSHLLFLLPNTKDDFCG